MNLHQYIRTFLQKNREKRIVKLGFAVAFALTMLGTAFTINVPITHAQDKQANVSAMEATINEVFGAYAPAAKRIAMCESSMNPNATNSFAIGGSHAAGLFQILYPSTWQTTSQAAYSPYDARANTIAAHDIFVRDGYSWREWACRA